MLVSGAGDIGFICLMRNTFFFKSEDFLGYEKKYSVSHVDYIYLWDTEHHILLLECYSAVLGS